VLMKIVRFRWPAVWRPALFSSTRITAPECHLGRHLVGWRNRAS